ncbi:uncharacterized protein LOC128223396 [Mya arenaria]|uniref:uncharacterized protein LOC128223396 n=1 Tax=Mya arenaria TaxID=6604 RepID=UPI0022E53B6A|nr:uncharacterized protein LOC128223396 [Mya arenaria]XP_052788646.1 uncharacterized protein LOC128223396 [Mya arenaria]XP_052788653.1 uncharacterized protein LOC128223396 [Mya arenaria]XP_052788661.1 uncharacterized protein LOC128223396 [Mya arenaria]
MPRNSPEGTGTIEIPKSVLEQLLRQLNMSEQIRNQMAANIDENGHPEVSVTNSSGGNDCESQRKKLVQQTSEPSQSNRRSFDYDMKRKSSAPAIFVFPECSESSFSSSQSYNSQLVSSDGLADTVRQCSETEVRQTGLEFRSFGDGAENSSFINEKHVKTGLFQKISLKSPPGVARIHFDAVVQELAKTKKYLHSLQMRQGLEHEKRHEFEKMKKENHALQIKTELLHKELQRVRNELQNTAKPSPVTKEKTAENMIGGEHAQGTIPNQTMAHSPDSSKEIQRLKAELEKVLEKNRVLCQQRDEFCDEAERMSQLQQLKQDEYNKMKHYVKILSECLQEEKNRNKAVEDERSKLTSQIGQLRQRFEILQMDKNALEKGLSFNEDRKRLPSKSTDSRLSSNINSETNSTKSGISSKSHINPKSGSVKPTAYDKTKVPFPLKSSSSNPGKVIEMPQKGELPQGSAMNIAPLYNDLSNQQMEEKVSNISGSATIEECPRCLQQFTDEKAYQIHLDKCVE